jgi:hypothetical protein
MTAHTLVSLDTSVSPHHARPLSPAYDLPGAIFARWRDEDATIAAERFTLTREQALAIGSDRIKLQDAYNRWLHDAARRRDRTLITTPYAEHAIARAWDTNGAAFMADAELALERAGRGL